MKITSGKNTNFKYCLLSSVMFTMGLLLLLSFTVQRISAHQRSLFSIGGKD